MFKGRKASVLVIGAMAAVAIGGGVALASTGGGDTVRPSQVSMADTLIADVTPAPSASNDDDNGTPFGDDNGTSTPSPEATTTAPAEKAPAPKAATTTTGAGISAAEAKKIALKAAGGGRVTEIERDTEHGRKVWEVEVQRGNVEHDLDIDRQNGDVLRHKKDKDDDRDDRDDD